MPRKRTPEELARMQEKLSLSLEIMKKVLSEYLTPEEMKEFFEGNQVPVNKN